MIDPVNSTGTLHPATDKRPGLICSIHSADCLGSAQSSRRLRSQEVLCAIHRSVSPFANHIDLIRIFGVTTLDVVRASTFVAEALDDLSLSTSTTVPVVGGHSGVTIVPLFTQTDPPLPSSIDSETIQALTKRVQFGGDEVVKAKDGAGSATLSMAQAGYLFATLVIDAIKGKKDVIAPSYVALAADPHGGAQLTKELGTELQYFSAKVTLGVSRLIIFLVLEATKPNPYIRWLYFSFH